MAAPSFLPPAWCRHSCAAILLALLPRSASAHGDVHEAIVEVTHEITAKPKEAGLYLRRGLLHRVHQDWAAATADFDRALELDPELAVADLARGEMLAQAGKGTEAKAALDRFLTRRPGDAAGLAARSRVLAAAGEWKRAADDLARALAAAKSPEPALFLDHAHALQRDGRVDEALAALDRGARRLGPLINFSLAAIDLEIAAGRSEAALARLEKVIANAPRKERWLLRRGQILEKAGSREAAHEAYRAARSALEKVPAARRQSAADQDLRQTIETSLTRTTPPAIAP